MILMRVPLNFDWPLHKVWRGYICELPDAKRCRVCDGEGLNAATRQISADWYDRDNFGVTWMYNYGVAPDGTPATRPPWQIIGTTKRWMYSLTQDEVASLWAKGRLFEPEFRHSKTVPLAADVNRVYLYAPLGHDAINQWICIEQRARRLGVYGKCPACHGRGHERYPRKLKKAHQRWERKPPRVGPGYQVWEDVSEGSPISPVFRTPQETADWLVSVKGYSRAAAAAFVDLDNGGGWCPSGLMVGGALYAEIESLVAP